jgi:hypothetical protein
VLRKARIVGMTTSGVAIMQKLINALQPKVLVIEEAGELFEANLLACLGPQTEHIILIGKHTCPLQLTRSPGLIWHLLGCKTGRDRLCGRALVTSAQIGERPIKARTQQHDAVGAGDHEQPACTVGAGDHEQLRPKPQYYPLEAASGKGYDLDISTFERLARTAGFPRVTLETQRRMHPHISRSVHHWRDESCAKQNSVRRRSRRVC